MVRRIRPTNADADDAAISDAVERASQGKFTREPPRTLQGRINFLLKQLKTTKGVAQGLGVTQRSVERYRKGERKHPPKAITDRIDAGSPWRPGLGSATTPPAEPPTTAASAASPSVSRPPAPGGCSTPIRGRSTESPNEAIAEGLQEHYFKDNGHRADHLEVEFTDIGYIDFEY